ncbi:hypothetical protein PG994_006189 [Apiospora phragmitis]|uniref:Uncharacterized protein n=1 Tax=Apiospora phragmitis TaxID=2905665 RepID=A0ABR1VI49_9PEZI
MKISLGLTAALLASSAHLVSTTRIAKVSQRDNVRIVARDPATWPPALGMPHPRQASDSPQQLREGTTCDIAGIRAATEKIQQLLSDFRNVSNAAIDQLESMETVLRGMGSATDNLDNTSTSATETVDVHSSTTSASPYPYGELTSTPGMAGLMSSSSSNTKCKSIVGARPDNAFQLFLSHNLGQQQRHPILGFCYEVDCYLLNADFDDKNEFAIVYLIAPYECTFTAHQIVTVLNSPHDKHNNHR